MATKTNKNASGTVSGLTVGVSDAARLCADATAGYAKAAGGLKAAYIALGKAVKADYTPGEREGALREAYAIVAKATGYSEGTARVYKSYARSAAGIPKANRGNGSKGASRRGGKASATVAPAVEKREEAPEETGILNTQNERLAAMVALLVRCQVKTADDAAQLARDAFARIAQPARR